MLKRISLGLALAILSSIVLAQPNTEFWYPETPEWLVEDTNTSDGSFVLHWEMLDQQEADYFQLSVKKANEEQQVAIMGNHHEFTLSELGAYMFRVQACWRTETGEDVCSEPTERLRVTYSNTGGDSKDREQAPVSKGTTLPAPSTPYGAWVNQAAKIYDIHWSFNYSIYNIYAYHLRRYYTTWLTKVSVVLQGASSNSSFYSDLKTRPVFSLTSGHKVSMDI